MTKNMKTNRNSPNKTLITINNKYFELLLANVASIWKTPTCVGYSKIQVLNSVKILVMHFCVAVMRSFLKLKGGGNLKIMGVVTFTLSRVKHKT